MGNKASQLLETLHFIQLQAYEFQQIFNKSKTYNSEDNSIKLHNIAQTILDLINKALKDNKKIIPTEIDAKLNQQLYELESLFNKFEHIFANLNDPHAFIEFSSENSMTEKIAKFHLGAFEFVKKEFIKNIKSLEDERIANLMRNLDEAKEDFTHSDYYNLDQQYDYAKFMNNCFTKVKHFQEEQLEDSKHNESIFRIVLSALAQLCEEHNLHTLKRLINSRLQKPNKEQKAYDNFLNFFQPPLQDIDARKTKENAETTTTHPPKL